MKILYGPKIFFIPAKEFIKNINFDMIYNKMSQDKDEESHGCHCLYFFVGTRSSMLLLFSSLFSIRMRSLTPSTTSCVSSTSFKPIVCRLLILYTPGQPADEMNISPKTPENVSLREQTVFGKAVVCILDSLHYN